MKKLLCFLSILSLTVAAFAATPSAPSGAFVPGLTTTPTTNAISAPMGFFPVALVYNASGIFTPAKATMFQWNPNVEADLLGYNLYFGDILAATNFPKLSVPKNVNNVVLLNLNTNIAYGFYVTAVNTSAQESAPSTLVVLKPGTP